MTIGSLFSGIGGLELGLERAGHGPVIWQAESDEYARRVLEKHWPDVKRYADVKEIDENAERPDIICGGFPCQDLSYAGKGEGINGSRSGLWGEFARIVRVLRPRIVVVENVPALLGRGMGRVAGDLAESGYDLWWDCIPAAAVGAPHRRDRVFIVAHANVAGLEGRHGQELRERAGERTAGPGGPPYVADAEGEPQRKQADETNPVAACRDTRSIAGRGGRWSIEPDVGRVVDGVPHRVDRLRCLGNAVVPAVAEHIGGLLPDTPGDET